MGVFEDSLLSITMATHGRDVDYTPYGGSLVTIKGIFSNAFIQINDVSTLSPTLRINLSDLSADPTTSDSVSIDSTDYSIVDIHKDGIGGVTLILQEV